MHQVTDRVLQTKMELSSFKSSDDFKRKKMGHTAVSDTESSSVNL